MDKHEAELFAVLLARSNMGLGLPDQGRVVNWDVNRPRYKADLFQECVDTFFQEFHDPDVDPDIFTEEAEGWLDRISQMDDGELRRSYSDIYKLIGIGLCPKDKKLARRKEVYDLLMKASYHYADDSGGEWKYAREAKEKAAHIMIEDGWDGRSIQEVTKWVGPIFPAEDMVYLVISILQEKVNEKVSA